MSPVVEKQGAFDSAAVPLRVAAAALRMTVFLRCSYL